MSVKKSNRKDSRSDYINMCHDIRVTSINMFNKASKAVYDSLSKPMLEEAAKMHHSASKGDSIYMNRDTTSSAFNTRERHLLNARICGEALIHDLSVFLEFAIRDGFLGTKNEATKKVGSLQSLISKCVAYMRKVMASDRKRFETWVIERFLSEEITLERFEELGIRDIDKIKKYYDETLAEKRMGDSGVAIKEDESRSSSHQNTKSIIFYESDKDRVIERVAIRIQEGLKHNDDFFRYIFKDLLTVMDKDLIESSYEDGKEDVPEQDLKEEPAEVPAS